MSTGNVTKFEQLMKTAHPKVQQAAQAGEISLHKAWRWRDLSPEEQLNELHLDQARTHVEKRSPTPPTPRTLGDLLRGSAIAESRELDSIAVIVINVPGSIAFLTQGAMQTFGALEE